MRAASTGFFDKRDYVALDDIAAVLAKTAVSPLVPVSMLVRCRRTGVRHVGGDRPCPDGGLRVVSMASLAQLPKPLAFLRARFRLV
jgi:hypothetical protein